MIMFVSQGDKRVAKKSTGASKSGMVGGQSGPKVVMAKQGGKQVNLTNIYATQQ